MFYVLQWRTLKKRWDWLALFLIFFEMLVRLNYTTLETRFLMYPGLPLIVFAAVALAAAYQLAARFSVRGANGALAAVVVALCGLSYQQGDLGMRFVYNMHASQREVADELAQLVPPNQKTTVLVYGGIAGALDYYARQRGRDVFFTTLGHQRYSIGSVTH